MLDLYLNYSFINLKENKKQQQPTLIKLPRYTIFLQKLKHSKIKRVTHIHVIFFLIYINDFSKITIKKKRKKFKNLYFKHAQQYIY